MFKIAEILLRMFAANIWHFGTSGFYFVEYLVNGCRYFPNILYIFFFFFFFFIQFYVPFKLFHSYRDESIGRWGENRSTRGKTTWHTRKQNLACPTCDSCPERGANPQRWDDRMIKSTEVSDLNHSATGAAIFYIWIHIDDMHWTSHENCQPKELHFFTPFSALFQKILVVSKI